MHGARRVDSASVPMPERDGGWLTILIHGLPNKDGFDIDSCEKVGSPNCDVDSGDDAALHQGDKPFLLEYR